MELLHLRFFGWPFPFPPLAFFGLGACFGAAGTGILVVVGTVGNWGTEAVGGVGSIIGMVREDGFVAMMLVGAMS